MKNKKVYYFIILFLVLYLVVFFFFFKKDDSAKNKNYGAFAIGNDAFFLYEKEGWLSINTRYKKNYNWYLFDVYRDNEFLSQYSMIYSGIWNMFDKDKNKIDASFNENIGISTDLPYKIKEYRESSESSLDGYTRQVLEKYNIPDNVELTTNRIIHVDIDNDGNLEKIYTVTNVFSEIEQSVTFGFIFLVDDNHIYMIYDKIFESNSLTDTCKPYVSHVIDFDSKNYVLVSCSYYSDLGKKVLLYRYKDKKIKEVISN